MIIKDMTKPLFNRIMDFLFGSNETVRKKKALKNSAKQLHKKGYKYYIYRKDLLTPAFAEYMYDIYGAVAGARVVFNGIKTPEQLIYSAVRFSVPENICTAIDSLDENQIRIDASKMNYKALYGQVKNSIDIIKHFFTLDEFNDVNAAYTKIQICRAFCMYDYYYVLRKFNSELVENVFSKKPVFHSEYGITLVDNLADFVSVTVPFAGIDGLDTVFAFLHQICNGVEIQESDFARIWKLTQLHEQNYVVENICRCIRQNTDYTPEFFTVPLNSVGKWLHALLSKAGITLHDIYEEQRKQRITTAEQAVFGDVPLQLLKHYTKQFGDRLGERQLGAFRYTEPLNCVYAFLKLPEIKNFSQFIQVLTIRGKAYAPDSLQSLFEGYHMLADMPHVIEALDGKLASNCQPGYELEHVLKTHVIDEELRLSVVRDIDLANAEAAGIIRTCMNALAQLVIILRRLSDDAAKVMGEMVTNWNQVERLLNKTAAEILDETSLKMEQMNRLLDEVVVVEPDNMKKTVFPGEHR
jgi:hypothetical protein